MLQSSVHWKTASMMYDTMSSEDIENVRNTYSKAKDSQAWKSSTGEMYKKTVLRRLCKLIDLDFDNIEQQKAYEDGFGLYCTFCLPPSTSSMKKSPCRTTFAKMSLILFLLYRLHNLISPL